MKRVLFLMLVFISIVFASCDNVSTVDNSDDQKIEKSSESDTILHQKI